MFQICFACGFATRSTPHRQGLTRTFLGRGFGSRSTPQPTVSLNCLCEDGLRKCLGPVVGMICLANIEAVSHQLPSVLGLENLWPSLALRWCHGCTASNQGGRWVCGKQPEQTWQHRHKVQGYAKLGVQTHTSTHVHMGGRTCTHRAHMHTSTHVHMGAHAHIHTRTRTSAFIHCIHAYMCTTTRTHTYTSTRACNQGLPRPQRWPIGAIGRPSAKPEVKGNQQASNHERSTNNMQS